MTKNLEIKTKAKEQNVCLWEIAEALGIPDSSLSRKLRRELPTAEKEQIFAIIDNISAAKQKSEV